MNDKKYKYSTFFPKALIILKKCDRILKKLKEGSNMSTEFNEESKAKTDSGDDSEYVYKKVIKKEQRRTWSVISIILAALSIILIYFSWVSLIFAVLSVVAAVISRKNLGYFDKIALTGLIISIFGIVFAATGIAFGEIFDSILG